MVYNPKLWRCTIQNCDDALTTQTCDDVLFKTVTMYNPKLLQCTIQKCYIVQPKTVTMFNEASLHIVRLNKTCVADT